MATFFGGVVWFSFGFVFFLNRAVLLMDESRGCNLWHLIAGSLSEGICVVTLLGSFQNIWNYRNVNLIYCKYLLLIV